MTAPDMMPAVVARYAYVTANGVGGGLCRECGEQRAAMEFVHVVVRRGKGRECEQRPYCTACVAAGRVSRSVRSTRRRSHGLTRDLLQLAETTLYPGVRYHALTADQRRHCYIVARHWWLSTDFWKQCRVFNHAQACSDVLAMTAALERRGLPVAIPPSPIHADDYADD